MKNSQLLLALSLAASALFFACEKKEDTPPGSPAPVAVSPAIPAENAAPSDTLAAADCLSQALAEMKAKDYQSAWASLEDALVSYRTALGEQSERLGDLHVIRAKCQINQSKNRAAAEEAAQALAIFQKTPGEQSLKAAEACRLLGEAFKFIHADTCIFYFQKALDLRRSLLGDTSHLVGESYVNLGFIQIFQGRLDTAESLLEKGLSIQAASLGNDHEDLIKTYNYLGLCHLQKGDDFTAAAHFEKGVSVGDKTGNASWMPTLNCLNNLGICLMHGQAYERAAWCYRQAIERRPDLEQSNHPSIATHYHNAGVCLMNVGKYEAALEPLFKSSKIRKLIFPNGSPQLADTYANIGECYTMLGRFDLAEFHLQEGIKYEPGSKEHSLFKSNALDFYVELRQRQGRLAEALAFANRAIEVLKFIKNGKIHDSDKATRNATGLTALKIKGSLCLEIFKKTGDENYLDSARQAFNLALELADRTWAQMLESNAKQRLTEVIYPVIEGALQIEALRLQKTGDPAHLEAAFALAEKNRNLLLREALQNRRAAGFAGIPQKLLSRERALQDSIANLEAQKIEELDKEADADAKIVNNLGGRILEAKKTFRALRDTFEKAYPAYFKLKYAIPTLSIFSMQKGLPDNRTAVVEYFFGDSTLFIFLVSKQKAMLFQQPVDAALTGSLDSLLATFYEHKTARKTDREKQDAFRQYIRQARFLYQKLLQPAIEQTAAAELVIIPDGKLCYLPFEALLTKTPEHQSFNYRHLPYLLLEKCVRNELSAALMLESMAEKPTGRGYVGFAPANRQDRRLVSRTADSLLLREVYRDFLLENLPGLKFNRPEVEHFQANAGGKKFVNEEATERNFKRHAPSAALLHLSLHGFANDKEPLLSLLAFDEKDESEDGLLHAHELYNLHLNASLVILSACKTGYGKLRLGEGAMSLSRAFKYAGCPNVVMSLWEADDESTFNIVRLFSDSLAAGLPKAAALTAAKKHYLLRKAPEEAAHPFFWATLALVGDNEPVPLGGKMAWLVWAGIAAAGLAGWWFWKKKGRW